jgi:hypothetical protein
MNNISYKSQIQDINSLVKNIQLIDRTRRTRKLLFSLSLVRARPKSKAFGTGSR